MSPGAAGAQDAAVAPSGDADAVGVTTYTLENVTVDGLALPASTPGTLTITTRQLRWQAAGASSTACLALPFQQLMLHAISRDGAPACIYCQVGEDGAELRLVPGGAEGGDGLDGIFAAMCESAAMCLDEEEEGEEAEEAREGFGRVGEMGGGEMFTADGMRRLDELLVVPEEFQNGREGEGERDLEEVVNGVGEALADCRFEDAEEGDSEEVVAS
jgi:Regulator of volume decrease after cellular swelling